MWPLLITLLVPAWLVSVWTSPQFTRVFPREGWCTRLVLLVWYGLVLGSWWYLPSALLWLLLLVIGVWAFLLFVDLRQRIGTHDSPPGRLSVLDGVRALAHRDYYLRNFERYGPVFKMSQYGQPTICVLGLERIEKLIKGHSKFLGPSTLAISKSVEGAFLRYMPPETHMVYGRLFRRAMSGPYASAQNRQIDRICAIHLQSFAGHESRPSPALQAIARRSLNHLLLGFDVDTVEEKRFDEAARGFAKRGIGWSLVRRDRQTLDEMRQMLVDRVESDAANLENANETAYGASVLVRLRQQDSTMPDHICLDNIIVMHRIATGNVSSLLSWLLYRWVTESSIVAEIRAEQPETRESSLRLFLAETLRTSQSEYLYRRVLREFEYEGCRFPQGWLVRGCVWESHHTTEAIAQPSQFRLRRDASDYDRRQFTPLGMGAHACNGGDVNELICLAFLNQLLHASDLRVTSANPLQRQMRHWSHWRPNFGMRMKFKETA